MNRASLITVYTPGSALHEPGVLVCGMLADLRASRSLAWRLATRDIRAQYRQSYLGYLWAFILPLANTTAWIFLNSTGIVRVADTGIPYPVYVFTGTMLWQTFIEALQSPLQQVSSARPMLAKLNFPRESLILSGIIKLLFSAGIKLLILLPAILFMGVVPDARLALAPFALLAILLMGITIGLWLTPMGMLYTDIGRAIPVLAQFAMYITPVVFAMPAGGTMARLFQLNFMTPLILTARAWLTGSASPMLLQFGVIVLASFFLLLIGWVLYRITMPVLIERMSA